MFIRRTTYRMAAELDNAEGQKAFEAALRETLRPQKIEGLINTTHVPNDDGSWTVVAVWSDKQIAEYETPRIEAAWHEFASQLAGPPLIEAGGVTFHERW